MMRLKFEILEGAWLTIAGADHEANRAVISVQKIVVSAIPRLVFPNSLGVCKIVKILNASMVASMKKRIGMKIFLIKKEDTIISNQTFVPVIVSKPCPHIGGSTLLPNVEHPSVVKFLQALPQGELGDTLGDLFYELIGGAFIQGTENLLPEVAGDQIPPGTFDDSQSA